MAEASLNLGLSILLGYYYGLTGILSGVLISLLLIVYSWKPYFLYKKGFEDNIWEYVWHYAKYLSLLLLACVASDYVLEHYARLESQSFVQWSISGMKAIVIYAFISLLLLYGLDQSARNFVRRFGGIVKR